MVLFKHFRIFHLGGTAVEDVMQRKDSPIHEFRARSTVPTAPSIPAKEPPGWGSNKDRRSELSEYQAQDHPSKATRKHAITEQLTTKDSKYQLHAPASEETSDEESSVGIRFSGLMRRGSGKSSDAIAYRLESGRKEITTPLVKFSSGRLTRPKMVTLSPGGRKSSTPLSVTEEGAVLGDEDEGGVEAAELPGGAVTGVSGTASGGEAGGSANGSRQAKASSMPTTKSM